MKALDSCIKALEASRPILIRHSQMLTVLEESVFAAHVNEAVKLVDAAFQRVLEESMEEA